MKISVTELSLPALNWAAAQALGKKVNILPRGDGLPPIMLVNGMDFSPCTSWNDGGPILDLKMINTVISEYWLATKDARFKWAASNQAGLMVLGPTRLIAGIRCLVASEMGDEVDIPSRLK